MNELVSNFWSSFVKELIHVSKGNIKGISDDCEIG